MGLHRLYDNTSYKSTELKYDGHDSSSQQSKQCYSCTSSYRLTGRVVREAVQFTLTYPREPVTGDLPHPSVQSPVETGGILNVPLIRKASTMESDCRPEGLTTQHFSPE